MCEVQFASVYGLHGFGLTALPGAKHNADTRLFLGGSKRSNCAWIHAEKARGGFVVFPFVVLVKTCTLT